MPLVSVIIPIYGVEQYIERCARSLFEQTLKDIEYIFVDDATKDHSIKILQNIIEEYPERKSNVTIIHHKTNQGLPQARKTGIKNANGKYIAHCDSDDSVDKEMYQVMVEHAEKEKFDIVICDLLKIDSTNRYHQSFFKETPSDKDYIFTNLFRNTCLHNLVGLLCNHQLYSNDLNYPTANMGEDFALVAQLFYYAHKIGYIQQPFYHYYQNPTSIMNNNNDGWIIKKYEQLKCNSDIIVNFLSSKRINKKYSLFLKLDHTLNCKFNIRDRKVLKENKNLFYQDINYKIYFKKGISLMDKIRLFLVSNRLHFLIDLKLRILNQ